MRLYDEIINDILTDLSGQDVVKLPVGDAADPISRDWQDAGKAMIWHMNWAGIIFLPWAIP